MLSDARMARTLQRAVVIWMQYVLKVVNANSQNILRHPQYSTHNQFSIEIFQRQYFKQTAMRRVRLYRFNSLQNISITIAIKTQIADSFISTVLVKQDCFTLVSIDAINGATADLYQRHRSRQLTKTSNIVKFVGTKRWSQMLPA